MFCSLQWQVITAEGTSITYVIIIIIIIIIVITV